MAKRKLSSFDPSLIELLLMAAGSPSETRILLGSEKLAISLKFRLFQIKRHMREEGHPDSALVNSLTFVSEGAAVIIRRQDVDVASAVKAAIATLREAQPQQEVADAPDLLVSSEDDEVYPPVDWAAIRPEQEK